jgi:hypothetical protein
LNRVDTKEPLGVSTPHIIRSTTKTIASPKTNIDECKTRQPLGQLSIFVTLLFSLWCELSNISGIHKVAHSTAHRSAIALPNLFGMV